MRKTFLIQAFAGLSLLAVVSCGGSPSHNQAGLAGRRETP